MASKDTTQFRCSFCGRSEGQVKKLIAGRTRGTYICDECVALCDEIIHEDAAHPAPRNSAFSS